MRENIKMVDGNSLAVNQYEIFVRVNGRCRVVVNAVDFKSAKELAEEKLASMILVSLKILTGVQSVESTNAEILQHSEMGDSSNAS